MTEADRIWLRHRVDYSPTLRALSVAWRVSTGYVQWRWRRRGRLLRTPTRSAVMLGCHVAGLGSAVFAAWQAGGLVAGAGVLALSCFILEWRLRP